MSYVKNCKEVSTSYWGAEKKAKVNASTATDLNPTHDSHAEPTSDWRI